MRSLEHSIQTLGSLIGFPSVSSTSNRDISDAVSERLESIGFRVEQTFYFDENQVEKVNLVARRDPKSAAGQKPGLAYFCHTDVVPALHWSGPGGDPFTGVVDDDRMYGRGACDMKGSLVAMIDAAAEVDVTEQSAPLWIVCTADEEVGFEGAKHLVRESHAYREIVAAQPISIIGEPTRLTVVHAHKGIVAIKLTSRGRAAHSSTRDGINANEAIVPMLQTLLDLNGRTLSEEKYCDPRFDPPTLSWNFGVSGGNNAVNITPEESVAWLSLRPMPEIDGEDLIEAVQQRAHSLGLEFRRIEGGAAMWIDPDADCIQQACELAGGRPHTVCYGTDGGELSELQHRVVIGPGDIAQAHTGQEYLELEQLRQGINLYRRAISRWC